MKVGAENRNKVIAAVALMAIAALLVLRMLFSSGPSPVPAAASTTSATGAASYRTARAAPRARTVAGRASGRKVSSAPHSIDPTLRYDWLDVSEKTKYHGNGRNIFLAQAEIPKPVAPAVVEKKVVTPQGPPPPPPINLKFYGFASKPGEPKKVFLSQGEDVFIAGEGEIVDRRYKVLRITPMSVEVEDVLNNNRQSIPLTQG
ncbi:MAG TPA: hypothetical protein VEH30_17295 [Terriglobales bacterium]|nr:hypothetical protein [Terriglobales bacterium]